MWFIERPTSRVGPRPNRSRHIERVARLVARGDDPADIVAVACAELAALLGSGSCRFEPWPWSTSYPRLPRSGRLPEVEIGAMLPPCIELIVGTDHPAVGRFVIDLEAKAPPDLEQCIAAVIVTDHVALAHARRAAAEPATDSPAPLRTT